MNIKIALLTICILLAIFGSFKILLDIGSSFKGKRVPNDPFYANTGGWGTVNIPLIKPFNLHCFDEPEKNWFVDEDYFDNYDEDGGVFYI